MVSAVHLRAIPAHDITSQLVFHFSTMRKGQPVDRGLVPLGQYLVLLGALQVHVALRTDTSLLTGKDDATKPQAAVLCSKICSLYLYGGASYADIEPYDGARFNMLIRCIDGGLPKQIPWQVSALQSSHQAPHCSCKASSTCSYTPSIRT